ncbi:O-methyltransferase family protein [Actinidia rufa]|uniref:O-methyltransferase family protein n=1 Tax=Actinidia rufa TaxID=165716 RepID=A0A7J0ENV5_9ERIC|nr:O-methyltransferase family protein [Actinidia rufa]
MQWPYNQYEYRKKLPRLDRPNLATDQMNIPEVGFGLHGREGIHVGGSDECLVVVEINDHLNDAAGHVGSNAVAVGVLGNGSPAHDVVEDVQFEEFGAGILILTPSLLPWRANEVEVMLLVGTMRNFTVSLLVSSEKMRVCLVGDGTLENGDWTWGDDELEMVVERRIGWLGLENEDDLSIPITHARTEMAREDQTAANEAMLEGQGNIWFCLFRFVETMALKCAVELRVADIIDSHGCPITLSQIASDIGSPSLDLNSLARIMNVLARMKLFDSVREGGNAFNKAHGSELWDVCFSRSRVCTKKFIDYMNCTSRIVNTLMLTGYKDGFDSVESVVDVGGGSGSTMIEIVKAHPHIKGTNFDLPHVVATAPAYPGVTHVGGDMLESIPHADVIPMQRIMHNWSDEDCIKILKNCRKAIPEKTGKVVILDVVVNPESDNAFDRVGMIFDIMMMALFSGGKERTELQWKRILEGGGFPRYKIIKIPTVESIIEAYPE